MDGWCDHIHIALTTQRWSLKKTKTKITPGKEKLRLKRRQRRQHKPQTLMFQFGLPALLMCVRFTVNTPFRSPRGLGVCVLLKIALAFENEN